jgi:hypothetical protein
MEYISSWSMLTMLMYGAKTNTRQTNAETPLDARRSWSRSFFFFNWLLQSLRTLTFLNGLLDPQTFGRTPWLGDQSNAGQEVYSDKNSYIVIFRQQYAGQKGKGKK